MPVRRLGAGHTRVKGDADGAGHQRKGEISGRRTGGKIFEGIDKN